MLLHSGEHGTPLSLKAYGWASSKGGEEEDGSRQWQLGSPCDLERKERKAPAHWVDALDQTLGRKWRRHTEQEGMDGLQSTSLEGTPKSMRFQIHFSILTEECSVNKITIFIKWVISVLRFVSNDLWKAVPQNNHLYCPTSLYFKST